MINWKTIISEYNDKPTLLEWLKLVKKALDESVLESVSVNNVDETTITLSFNFADGTKIVTPSITLPRGLTGKDGISVTGFDTVSVQQAPDNVTLTTVRASFSDGKTDNFAISAINGTNGVSVTGFDTVSDEVVGNETLTTIRTHFSNGNTNEFVVTATNGKDGGVTKVYKHIIKLKKQDDNSIFHFVSYATFDVKLDTTNFNLLLDDQILIKEDVNAAGYTFIGRARRVTQIGPTSFSFELYGAIYINCDFISDEVTEV